jgi:hypothetical protein
VPSRKNRSEPVIAIRPFIQIERAADAVSLVVT